jgi:dihydrofolate reductase
MRKLLMFNMISLDGYFEGPENDINWHATDSEFNQFAIDQLNEIDTIIFGKKTFDLMVSYWPRPEAIKNDPVIARMMNEKLKIVCSTTLSGTDWHNTMLLRKGVEQEIGKLKEGHGKDIIIFGSANLGSSLTRAGLIDEYRLMLNPVVLNSGTPLFKEPISLGLKSSRQFGNGNVLLTYVSMSQ